MSEVTMEDTGRPEQIAEADAEAAKVQAAKAELYDEQSADPQTSLSTDDLILGKYKSTDELATAYQNLQREYTRLKGGELQVGEPDPVPPVEAQADEPAGEAPADTRPELTEESIATLTRTIHEQAGGQAEYQRILQWASNSLDAERIGAYNQAIEQGNLPTIINSLKGMQYDYMMKNGYEPRLTAGRAPAQEVKGFGSRYQVEQAMNDPRYQADAGYRRDVEQRIAATPNELFGL